ncbi:hypothetical protein KI387_038287, partial [Taxus chinensis]
RKILEISGLRENTYVPSVMHLLPLHPSMDAAREEAEQVMYGALDNLFQKTRLKPKDIGGVIAIDLANDMLQVHGCPYVVDVGTENITQNWYFGFMARANDILCFVINWGTMILSEKLRETIEDFFDCQLKLFIEFTGLI